MRISLIVYVWRGSMNGYDVSCKVTSTLSEICKFIRGIGPASS
jgi:hypothetical protein